MALSSDLFRTDWVQARLRAEVPLRDVRGAAAYAAITKGVHEFYPDEAFVVPMGEFSPEDSPPPARGRQVARSLFGVVIATRHYMDDRGEQAVQHVPPVIGQVRKALMGWTPVDADGNALSGARPCWWLKGEILDYNHETLLWSEVFATQHHIGSYP